MTTNFVYVGLLALGAFVGVSAVSLSDHIDSRGPESALSLGGGSACVEGTVSVTVTATNTKILQSGPADNMAATELFVEMTQANSKLVAMSNGGKSTVTSTYNIYSKLCFPQDPTAAQNVQTVQFLTHGGTLDNTYWDLGPSNSYVDAATTAGYATFSYDRLGTGRSDHPDPIQVVQASIQVEIAHVLVQMLRAGKVGGRSFKNVVGVSHSLGSGLTVGQTSRYPKDLDAVILQGISTSFTYAAAGIASTAMQIANTDPSKKFSGLANGYFTPAPVPQAIQFAFYRYPYFDPQGLISVPLVAFDPFKLISSK